MKLEIRGDITSERMKGWCQSEKKKKKHLVLDVTGVRRKV